MQTAYFNPNGGPLTAKVTSGFAQPGSYELRLWVKDRNRLVVWPDGQEKPTGNFINADDDEYALPMPPSENDGRLVECFAAIEITPPLNDYSIALGVYQDGALLAEDVKEDTGAADFATIVADLFVELIPS